MLIRQVIAKGIVASLGIIRSGFVDLVIKKTR
jgi:hypothetical protein